MVSQSVTTWDTGNTDDFCGPSETLSYELGCSESSWHFRKQARSADFLAAVQVPAQLYHNLWSDQRSCESPV